MRPIRTSRVMAASAALVLSLGLVACGSETEPTASDPEPTSETSPAQEPTPTEEPSKQAQADEADLPGDPMDGMPPVAGDQLAVVGVEVGDVLNVRALPDPEAETVGDGLDPVAEGLEATGRNRLVDSGIWAELETEAGFGWANTTFLAYLGEAAPEQVDVASQASSKDLAEAIAAARGDGEVILVAEQGQTITADLMFAEDDSLRGERLTITTRADGDQLAAESVTVAPLCARGVSDEGLCL